MHVEIKGRALWNIFACITSLNIKLENELKSTKNSASSKLRHLHYKLYDHRICIESIFMKQDVSHRNNLKTRFYRFLKHKYGLFFQKKHIFTWSAESGKFHCYSQL